MSERSGDVEIVHFYFACKDDTLCPFNVIGSTPRAVSFAPFGVTVRFAHRDAHKGRLYTWVTTPFISVCKDTTFLWDEQRIYNIS